MSTRWYPIYQKGNPQLRVFLPNFWMKLVKPPASTLPNYVHFECSMEMTKHDVKNYLQKIYKIPVVDVKTRIVTGKFKKEVVKGYVLKEDDIKLAYVLMPKNEKFEFPNIFGGKSEEEEQLESLEENKKTFKSYMKRNKDRPDIPSWFTI